MAKDVSILPHEDVSILPHEAVLPYEAKYNTWFYIGGSGLDRIQLLRIRIGLGLKKFTVCSSLEGTVIVS